MYKLKVGLISGAFPPIKCGVGDYTYHLACHLANAGTDVFVVTSQPEQNEPLYVSDAVQCRVRRSMKTWNFSEWPGITRPLLAEKPDIVDIQYPSNMGKRNRSILANLVPLLARLSCPNARVVTTLHEFTARRIRWKIRASINLLCSHHIVAVAKEDYHHLKKLPLLRHRISYVPIAPNILPRQDVFRNRAITRSRLGVQEGELLLLYFGFIDPQKGVDLLLCTFQELLSKERGVKLLLIGDLDTKNPYHLFIHQLIQQIDPLGKFILRQGYIPASMLSEYLAAADIGIFPYLDGVSERRGSLLAALMHGLPVITTHPLSSEMPFINQRDILFALPNIESLLKAVESLLKSPELRKRLGQSGQVVAQQFNWQHVVQEKLSVYNSLLQRKRVV
jgi:glycosyltransferase involved in cell wall biosynthesis